MNTYEYRLDRGMADIVRGGYATREEAEKAGREEAAYLAENGLDTVFIAVSLETNDDDERIDYEDSEPEYLSRLTAPVI